VRILDNRAPARNTWWPVRSTPQDRRTVRSTPQDRRIVWRVAARPETPDVIHGGIVRSTRPDVMVVSSEARHRTVELFGGRSHLSFEDVDARPRTLEDERRRTMVVQRGSTDARIHVWRFKPFPQDVSRSTFGRWWADVWTLVNGTNGTNGALEQLTTDWLLRKLSTAALFAVITA